MSSSRNSDWGCSDSIALLIEAVASISHSSVIAVALAVAVTVTIQIAIALTVSSEGSLLLITVGDCVRDG